MNYDSDIISSKLDNSRGVYYHFTRVTIQGASYIITYDSDIISGKWNMSKGVNYIKGTTTPSVGGLGLRGGPSREQYAGGLEMAECDGQQQGSAASRVTLLYISLQQL